MKQHSHIYIGIATVFIAAFTLFSIFYGIEKMMTDCENDPEFSSACEQLDGFTVTVLVMLLIIGGFIITITATGYILFTAS